MTTSAYQDCTGGSEDQSLYTRIARFYDAWIRSDSAREPSEQFYVSRALQSPGTVLEIGIGTGRIGLKIARQGRPIIGLDSCKEMLQRCESNARKQGIEIGKDLTLLLGDIRQIHIANSVEMVIMPLRTIGHFLTKHDKSELFNAVYNALQPGGFFIFDHFVFSAATASSMEGIPRLLLTERKDDHTTIVLWHTTRSQNRERLLNCLLTVEEVNALGDVTTRSHYDYNLGWVEPQEVRNLSADFGFEISNLYGGFSEEPFDDYSSEQVWVLKKPLINTF